jgi:hypothetical protein
MDWSVLTSPETLVAAGWGGGLALVIVGAFMVIWRIRAPREKQLVAGGASAHIPAGSARAGIDGVAVRNGAVAPLEDTRMGSGTFATAVNCIDGRAQGPVSDWIKIHCQATFVDTITTPGPDKLLSGGSNSNVEHIREAVAISVNAHKSGAVAIAGHHDCAANPASADEHKEQIRAAVAAVQSWGLPVRIVGLWVNEWWQVEVIADEPSRVAS